MLQRRNLIALSMTALIGAFATKAMGEEPAQPMRPADGGRTRDDTWIMRWTRVAARC